MYMYVYVYMYVCNSQTGLTFVIVKLTVLCMMARKVLT